MFSVRLDSIRYGWLNMTFGTHCVEGSDFRFCDSPRRLLEAVANVLDNPDRTEYVLWTDEPGAVIMRVEMTDGKFEISLFRSSEDSLSIGISQPELKECCAGLCWTQTCEIKKLVDDLTVDFSLYENGNGRALYEQHWMPFPDEEYRRLKHHAFALEKTLGEYENMLVTTYTTEE